MRIASLRLKNVGPFRGEHVLELEAKVYAIVARLVGDAERSNWLGKTTLLSAVRLAITGEHWGDYEDGWISIGEKFGEVEVALTTGERFMRSRERGKRTTTFFFPADSTKASMQDEAQGKIYSTIGLSKVDFSETCFFPQKKMSKFLTAEPSERMKIVSGWFDLKPLEKCEARVRKMAADLEDAAKKTAGYLEALDQRERSILESKNPLTGEAFRRTRVEIEQLVENSRLSSSTADAALAGLEERLQQAFARKADEANEEAYRGVVTEGKRLRDEMKGVDVEALKAEHQRLLDRSKDLAASAGQMSREEQQKLILAKGEFDGKCPVAGIDCPARAAINDLRTEGRQQHAVATERLAAARQDLHKVNADEARARAAYQEAERKSAILVELRKRASELSKNRTGGEDSRPVVESARFDLEEGRKMARHHAEELVTRTRLLEELDECAKTRASIADASASRTAVLATYREAAVVFGKRGAQRRVAEGALASIERDANDVLHDCGADLRVEVRWSREQKGLAEACDACGQPFPSSAKAKECTRCGAARGPKMENKLDVALSNRSGAAEDLAGAALQLAAARWLREARGTAWGTALLDEPFGSLDGAHRRGFAAHLTAMLGRYGFSQGFITAHHASILDAMPGRIVIVSDGKWSVPRVES